MVGIMERHYTLKEIAEMFSVRYETVLNWVKSGKIKAVVLPSGRLRISESEVKKLKGLE